ncbi:hypothetical protein VNO80_15739 [Phaseolus coccineus]|uniref:Uncharacterized protein n=1 Tax=Phaseolus coccineus TaxID=3886 RepID=A0AAN9MQU1_PHACN
MKAPTSTTFSAFKRKISGKFRSTPPSTRQGGTPSGGSLGGAGEGNLFRVVIKGKEAGIAAEVGAHIG